MSKQQASKAELGRWIEGLTRCGRTERDSRLSGAFYNMSAHWPTSVLIHSPKMIERQRWGEKIDGNNMWGPVHTPPEPPSLVSGIVHYWQDFLAYIFIKLSMARVYYHLRFLFTILTHSNWVTDLKTKNTFKIYHLRVPVIYYIEILKLNYNMI